MLDTIHTVNEMGLRHQLRHQPGEDRILALQSGKRLLLAAADGHGGAAYARSGMGARIALAAARQVLLEERHPVRERAGAVRARFQRLILRDLERRPATEAERAGLAGAPETYLYGTTLVCALCEPNGTFLLQIGDGDVHILGRNGRFFRPLPEDAACCAGETSSLVQADAAKRIRWARCGPAAAVILHTDGYFCREERPVLLAERLCLPDGYEAGIPEVLVEEGRHGDDLSLLVAYDRAAVAGEPFRTGVAREVDVVRRARERRELLRRRNELRQLLYLVTEKLKRAPQGDAFDALADRARAYLQEFKRTERLLAGEEDRRI